MNRINLLLLVLIVFNLQVVEAQDLRSTETRVADILAMVPPVRSDEYFRILSEMNTLEEEGLRMICLQVSPSDSGKDTRARWAVENYSLYLVTNGSEEDMMRWESLCGDVINNSTDKEIRSLFFRQLSYSAGKVAVSTAMAYLDDPMHCSEAVAVISGAEGEVAFEPILKAITNSSGQCQITLIRALASIAPGEGTDLLMRLSKSRDTKLSMESRIALATGGSPEAYKIVRRAAKKVNFGSESSNLTSTYLAFALATGGNGNIELAKLICEEVIKNNRDGGSNTLYIRSLDILVLVLGNDAFSYLMEGAQSVSPDVRNAALRLTLRVDPAISRIGLLKLYDEKNNSDKVSILNIMGQIGGDAIISKLKNELGSQDKEIRGEALKSLAIAGGANEVSYIVDFLALSDSEYDHGYGIEALKYINSESVVGEIDQLLYSSNELQKRSAIELLALFGDKSWFPVMADMATSDSEIVREAAIRSLSGFADSVDITTLIDMLDKTDEPSMRYLIADAVESSIMAGGDETVLYSSLLTEDHKLFLLPALKVLGNEKALNFLYHEFEVGSPEVKDVAFRTILSWPDSKAATILLAIAESGDQRYGRPAFSAYMKYAELEPMTTEQRILILKGLIRTAKNYDSQHIVADILSKQKGYSALFLAGELINLPDYETPAAKALIKIILPAAGSETGLSGSLCKSYLNKAISILDGKYDSKIVDKAKEYYSKMNDKEGFISLFNGGDLSGWQGLVGNPISREKMGSDEQRIKSEDANIKVHDNWRVENSEIHFSGAGDNLCTISDYSDFELLVDWKIGKKGDSGIYLRGSPQVQIWDTSRVEVGAQVGSGGLYNNSKGVSHPLVVADNPVGEWNNFRIVMVGERVSVWLNGILVTDNVIMENYWDRSIPIFPTGQIELQAHGTDIAFRDIYIREIENRESLLLPQEKEAGFVSLFNGMDLDNWLGDKLSYVVEDGAITVKPEKGSTGNLYTAREYSDFIFRFEFMLSPGGNNGLGIRAPLEGDAAYVGMELQILDNYASIYANLAPYQYHGSVYGVIPARRDYLKPAGEWNYQEVYVKGDSVRVVLNGTTIVDGDIGDAKLNGTMDGREHPGLQRNRGHIGFLGHGSVVRFRRIRVLEL